MNIRKAAILGAGAVGSYLIWGLSQRTDIQLGIIAEGERAQRLKEKGCRINGSLYHPEVWSPEEARGIDLLVVTLKYGALRPALPAIKEAVGSGTIVMSLMNGVDSEEIISTVVPKEQILYSFIKIASRRTDGECIFDPETTQGIIYGEEKAPFDSARVLAVQALFEGTGIHFRISEDILAELWAKFRLNVCNNLAQAILGAGVGCYRDSVHMQAISDGLRGELMAIAAARGIDLSRVDASTDRGCAVLPSARYSTLQDLDAGRHTEIDMFSGALMRMGEELGIPTPYNTYTYHMIKALEEKNDGKFEYKGDEEVVWAK